MKLILAAALLLPITAAAEAPLPSTAQPVKPQAAQMPVKPERAQMPNLLSSGATRCTPLARQVADANKRPRERTGDSRTLDREPNAHLLLAVDRQVAGCREVTFLRRNAAPGSVMPNVAPERD